jgi:hypothetical protein
MQCLPVPCQEFPLVSPHKSPALPPGVAHSRQFAVLMLIALIAAGSPLPFSAVAVVPLVWAGVESILSIRARSTARAPARGIVSSVVGLALVCALTLVVLLPYAVYDTSKSLQDCTLGANTAIATADCNSRYNTSLDSIAGGFLNFEKRAGG